MIAVAGLNSAIDKLLELDALTPGRVLRARNAGVWPGGKGVHAAACAAALDQTVRLTGLVDDAQREWFATWLRARRVDFHAIDTPTPVRTCLAIRDAGGRITEILEPGAPIDADVYEAALHTAVNVCRTSTVAVLTGSVPPGMPGETYRDIIAAVTGPRVLVDASGELLRHALTLRPFAVKPNRTEAEEVTGTRIDSPESAAAAARRLVQSGVHLAVISLGAEGAVAFWDGRGCHVTPPRVTAVNEVGAGDCLLGALAAGLARGDGIVDALRLAVAAGTAKVLSPETGGVRRRDIDDMLPAIRVRWLA